jgi:hypothetical protein
MVKVTGYYVDEHVMLTSKIALEFSINIARNNPFDVIIESGLCVIFDEIEKDHCIFSLLFAIGFFEHCLEITKILFKAQCHLFVNLP